MSLKSVCWTTDSQEKKEDSIRTIHSPSQFCCPGIKINPHGLKHLEKLPQDNEKWGEGLFSTITEVESVKSSLGMPGDKVNRWDWQKAAPSGPDTTGYNCTWQRACQGKTLLTPKQ